MREPIRSVWVVMERDPRHEGDDPALALLADSLESAKAGAADYVGEASLEWKHRNSIFDFQDYLVAVHGEYEYHVFEQEVEHHAER